MLKNVSLLRVAAFAEATTLVVLMCVAMPLKYIGGFREATAIMGPIHGMAFLFFGWVVFREYFSSQIDGKVTLRLVIGAFIPFGGFVNERWLANRERSK